MLETSLENFSKRCQCNERWDAWSLLQVRRRRENKLTETRQTATAVTWWRQVHVVMWVGKGSDVMACDVTDDAQCFAIDLKRTEASMRCLHWALSCVLESTKLRIGSCRQHWCHYQWPCGCANQRDDLFWPSNARWQRRLMRFDTSLDFLNYVAFPRCRRHRKST